MGYKEPVSSEQISDGEIANVDISASAGIQHSKMESDARARANHTGTQLTATISDFSTAAQAQNLAGNGLLRTGATIDIVVGTGLLLLPDQLNIDTTVVARLTASGTFLNAMTFSGIINGGSHRRATISIDATGSPFPASVVVHDIILVNTGLGAVTVVLPALHAIGDNITVKDKSGNAATNNITIDPSDADTTDGDPSTTIAVNFGATTFTSDGTNWFITSSHLV